jgi:hypothetical protein
MTNERLDLKSLHVLVVCAKPHVVAVLRQVLGIARVQNIELAGDAQPLSNFFATSVSTRCCATRRWRPAISVMPRGARPI